MPAPGTVVERTTYNSAQYGLYLVISGNGGSAPASVSAYKTSNAASVTVSKDIPSATPTRTGYKFLGYAVGSANNAVSKQPGNTMSYTFSRKTVSSTTSTQVIDGVTYITTQWTCRNQSYDYNLYAKWEKLTYTVAYNANGGSDTPDSQTKTYGDNLTLTSAVPTRTNYNFKNWNTKADGTGTSYASGGTYTGNTNLTLYAIWEPAGGKLTSVDNCNINTGLDKRAYWTVVNSAHRYKLTFSIEGADDYTVPASGYIAAGTDNYAFVLPVSWYDALPNVTSKTATCTLKTYSGSTLIGTSSKAFTVSVGQSIVPTVTATIAPKSSNTKVNGWGVAVQGYSFFRFEVNYTLPPGTTLKSVSIVGPGINGTYTSYTSGSTKDTSVIKSSGSKSYTVVVTDSRGRTASTTLYDTVISYAPPRISGMQIGRADADGNVANGSGLYVWFTPTFSKSSIVVDGVEKNTYGTRSAQYTLHGSSAVLGTESPISSGTTYKPTDTSFPVALGSAYDLTVSITDQLNTTVKTVTLPSASGFWYGRGNDRLGLGVPPPGPGFFCDWDATFKGAFDLARRRCSASLGHAGWYRVLRTGSPTAGTSRIIDLAITRTYVNTNNESHCVRFISNYDRPSFCDETSKSNTQLIDKVRYTKDGTYGYIDIHYTGSSANTVSVDFEVRSTVSVKASCNAESLQEVASAPSGETILATYDLSANGTVINNGIIQTDSLVVGERTSFYEFSIPANSSASIPLANGQKGFVVLSGASSAKEMVIVNATTSGVVTYVSVTGNSGFTYSVSANTLHISNGTQYAVIGLVVYF